MHAAKRAKVDGSTVLTKREKCVVLLACLGALGLLSLTFVLGPHTVPPGFDALPTAPGRALLLERLSLVGIAAILLGTAATVALRGRAEVAEPDTELADLRQANERLERANRDLRHHLEHDPLTGLPNRDTLLRLFDRRQKRRGPPAGVLLIGLDRFKAFNDSQGREEGDAALRRFAASLTSCINEDEVAARIGGDQFALLVEEPPLGVARRVFAATERAFAAREGRRGVPLRLSIGLVSSEHMQESPTEILSDATIALQSAKDRGGGQTVVFTEEMREGRLARLALQRELPRAIVDGQIEPWFQPQVRLADGRLRGVEALARWRHPQQGLLTPDRFLGPAQKLGQIDALDYAIWEAAIREAAGWRLRGGPRLSLSLNAAPETLADPDLLERLLLMLQRHAVDPADIVIEILETTFFERGDTRAETNIGRLAAAGFALELDDFGTGYASLSRLTHLPISGLKLDRSLVMLLPDPAADSVVRAILALAQSLDLHVVAEGIETARQARHLTAQGCTFAQGFGYARPMAAAALSDWIGRTAGQPLQVVEPMRPGCPG